MSVSPNIPRKGNGYDRPHNWRRCWTIFCSRKELSASGVHPPPMSGIWPTKGEANSEGAYSIILSGGYDDDIDNLDEVSYTGQGGQDKPGGRQIADQEFTRGNYGLQLSCHYQLPVRVTRGHQVEYGPEAGYKYDGLYFVKNYERVKGNSGFFICRFYLVSEASFDSLERALGRTFKPTHKPPKRTLTSIHRLNRNIKNSEKVKKLYGYECQVCGVRLNTPTGPIAIGAHIKPLGFPHDGPDIIENMLCLCPNHHDQFDKLAFYIEPDSLIINGLDSHLSKRITKHPRHYIDNSFLEYHKKRIKFSD